MIFKKTELDNLLLIKVEEKVDIRGFFTRIWCKHELLSNGIATSISQSNIAYNKTKGTLRGLHYQNKPFEEEKMVVCLQGAIYDVVVDLRPSSKTYLQWAAFRLTSRNNKMLFIPNGFAHGYQTVENYSLVLYFVSEFYTPQAEAGIRYNDPFFNISWPSKIRSISDKDKAWPDFKKPEATK